MDDFILKKDLNNSWFILGDLNMDLLTNKGDKLREFMCNNALINFIGKNKKGDDTSSLIDVVLHNKNDIVSTKIVEFPYSDHDIVVVNCNIVAKKCSKDLVFARKLSSKKIDEIALELNEIDFSILNEIKNVNLRWSLFKQIIINSINNVAPLRKCKSRKLKSLPWYDGELIKAERRS